MTALLALAGRAAEQDDQAVHALLRRALHGAPCSTVVVRPSSDVVMGVASPDWDGTAASRVATDGRFTAVAHAAVFYRPHLDAALTAAGHAPLPAGASSADAVVHAARAWGPDGVRRLEGEFAYVVWDSRDRTLFAARDHSGSRTLFHAAIAATGFAVTSTLRLARAVTGSGTSWNLLALAEDAADIDLAYPTETVFASISRLPAAHALQWRPGAPARVWRWWEIPIFEQDSGVPFDEAAEELRRLIADAVAERADLHRGTAVMLSGGYDSTAVYGAGNWRLAPPRGPSRLKAVSFSHPPGDPGREDEWIDATVARWGGTTRYIPCDNVPAIEPSLERARRRDEPLYHVYELWNRALARGCAEVGARVALNGNGGDPWFSTSPIFLADLLRQGRWLQFRREWRTLIGRLDWYRVFKVAIQPNLPGWMLSAIAALRGGRPLRDRRVREIPPWVGGAARAGGELARRRRTSHSRRPGESLSAAERTWFLRESFSERITALVFAIAAHEGVELRTPLQDSRIVRFAATRPRWESNSQRHNKHLLRGSMRGVLPDEVIARRTARTGLPSTYFGRTARAHIEEALSAFSSGMFLADLGVIDHGILLNELNSCLAGRWQDDERAAGLIAAVQAEWWLRSMG